MVVKKRKTAAKKKAAKKQGAGLARYRTAMKKGTSAIQKRIVAAERRLKQLKNEKAKKVKTLRKKLKK